MSEASTVTSAQVRDELLDLLERDLMGPWDGPDESIVGTPRGRYLVGALAPISIDETTPEQATTADLVDDDSVSTDLNRSREVQGIPSDDDDEVSDGDARENTDDRGPESKIIAPSSMGVRFRIPKDAPPLRFTPSWGRYASRRETDDSGTTKTYYDRHPGGEPVEVDVASIPAGTSRRLDIEAGQVELAIEVYDHDGALVVEAALLNTVVTGRELPPRLWLFQAALAVEAVDGSPVFLPTRDALDRDRGHRDREAQRLDLLYRDRLEFAIGRTASVTWDLPSPGSRRATTVRTTWLPTAEIPQTLAPEVPDAVMSMRVLMDASVEELEAGLHPLIAGYDAWLGDEAAEAAKLPGWLRDQAELGLDEGTLASKRLREGLAVLLADERARAAFAFMNRTMRDQRIHSQIASARAADKSLSEADARAAIETKGDAAASWRAFQLAFILMQLPAIVDPTLPRRSSELPRAELLFFPTGGGKTEAYLGLAAFTFGMRRLQGIVDSPDGALDGGDGVSVLMRYTLRLLTSQQFLRATTLMCAAELVRREDPETWGTTPFRIGLWVGSSVSPKRYTEAAKQVADVRAEDRATVSAYGLTVLQFSHCPWCGTPINPRANVEADDVEQRIRVYCGARSGCPFRMGGAAVEGLPVLTVDDEIYRHPPTFLLATVDKFARLAREGEAAALFGFVSKRCPRHGYQHPDSTVCTGDSHNAKRAGGVAHPAVHVQAATRLRPPDLIIQDELHLITGALGTAVGLFEGAIDVLSTWRSGADAETAATVKPLVVASTATVRKAADQVRKLYARQVQVFPPQVLSVSDTFFSKEVAITPETPGRRYLGVCAHGARLTLAEIRISEILLLAGQRLFDAHGDVADPYMTLVDYFSATRELAGMRRYLDDDVANRISNPDAASGYARRATNGLRIGELTSRISSAQISDTLTALAVPFDASRDSTSGKAEWAKIAAAADAQGKKLPPRDWAYDVVLATSMLQVGVDVPRLGLMLIVGQPKNTAEYIQASSRVGRDAKKPGLVVTLANRSRPRDMAHYEQFEHYHDTFYANVEALSVTPYSEAALERGLTGLIVSATRVADATVAASESLSPDTKAGAGRIAARRAAVDGLVDRLTARMSIAANDGGLAAKSAMSKLVLRLDKWTEQADLVNKGLTYVKASLPGQYVKPLLISPEDEISETGDKLFQVANSMREVQPEINLRVAPQQLSEPASTIVPKWTFPNKSAKTK
ncbi:helicase [Agromyces luteolus]|uniref:DISARM system helicase DrmA n=1 Tax=Agromyces luteolus TaxID=88373 RepID=UPI0014124397|nr:DISARM system helicase DrmA [Agromyces luteolus]GLK28623.1 helicase [Agromyces luteolus]